MGVYLNNVGYYTYTYKFHNIPNGFWSKIRYILKIVVYNINKPFKNRFLNKIQNWHILDCNLRFEHSKKYFIKGNPKELRALKNILLKKYKCSKGKISYTSKCLDYIFFIKNPNNFKNTFFIISKDEYLEKSNNFKIMNSNSLIIFCEDFTSLEIETENSYKEFNFKRIS
jgi:hypothetical protein